LLTCQTVKHKSKSVMFVPGKQLTVQMVMLASMACALTRCQY